MTRSPWLHLASFIAGALFLLIFISWRATVSYSCVDYHNAMTHKLVSFACIRKDAL